ncbi:inositol-pentakisphosphate 2-kinase-domain-containing protein [Xylariaceae sp. FL0662B]|nr:inositol-pentakisphosphate 2-kinase-domain-containing protein [Xylariaceae sp. FL0662B]
MKALLAIWKELSKPLPRGSAADDISSIITPEDREELARILEQSEFGYLAEGRANVLFTIKQPGSPAIPKGLFEGTLLRVPKLTPGVTPCDYETLQDFQEKSVDVLVGREHIVPQLLVEISGGVAGRLNAQRHHAADGSTILPGHAMLVEDMGPSPDYRVLEFKPKWLAQSPLAPPGATRCRTCAREAFRNSQKKKEDRGPAPPPPPVCPLGLLHADRAVLMSSVDRLAPSWPERDRERLADALRGSGLLERLRQLQVRGDRGDLLFRDPSDPGFGLAMTLRDCSCYVRVPVADERAPVVVKLADVDKKNWREKQTYWQESHRNLVENGWYTGEEAAEGDEPLVETACVLRLDHCLATGIDDIPFPFRERLFAS